MRKLWQLFLTAKHCSSSSQSPTATVLLLSHDSGEPKAHNSGTVQCCMLLRYEMHCVQTVCMLPQAPTVISVIVPYASNIVLISSKLNENGNPPTNILGAGSYGASSEGPPRSCLLPPVPRSLEDILLCTAKRTMIVAGLGPPSCRGCLSLTCHLQTACGFKTA